MRHLIVTIFFVIFLASGGESADFSFHPDSSDAFLKLQMRGSVELGDLYKLQALLSSVEYSKTKRVQKRALYLDSVGGNLSESLKIGRYLRDSRIRTVIDSDQTCESACAYLFLGGTQERTGLAHRQKSKTGTLGVHTFAVTTEKEVYSKSDITRATLAAQQQSLDLVRYLIEVDGDPRILDLAASTPPDGMRHIRNDEALSFCIYIWDKDLDIRANPVNPYKIAQTTEYKITNRWAKAPCRNP